MTGGEQRCQVSDLSDSVEFFGNNGDSVPEGRNGEYKLMVADFDISLKDHYGHEMIKPKERTV